VFDFIIKNKWLIIFSILGLVAGYLLSRYANKLSENKIIEILTAEIESLKNKRLNADQQKRLIELEAQLKLLTNK